MTLPVGAETLSRSRIAAEAARMGLRITSEEQFAFLEARGPLQLQAVPGSGKTTLVALKLALLARDWSADLQGMCVLSHTNTATQEITSRLAGTAGHRLLRYPHFIGTIQSFTHTFLALPALHSKGITPRAIDDDTFAAHARRLLHIAEPYQTLRNFLYRRTNGWDIAAKATYVFESGQQHLQIADTPFSRSTASYRQLLLLKGDLARAGFYRYRDMYAIAAQRLDHHPRLVAGLRRRFPFVLIDEMQDTDTIQLDLLRSVFDDAVIMQCVGDVNQRIYHDNPSDDGSFPAGDSLELTASQRFGPAIAKVASRLTVNRPQTINGHGPDAALAVFSFAENTIDRVGPAFENLVRRTVPYAAINAHPPIILGAREDPGSSRLFPRAIGCYLPHITAPHADKQGNDLLITYRTAAAAVNHDGRLHPAVTLLWNAVRDAVWHHQARQQPKRIPQRLPAFAELDRHIPSPGHQIRLLLIRMLTDNSDDPARWRQFAESLVDAIAQLSDNPMYATGHLRDHLASYTPPARQAEAATTVAAGTTAGAKGETHSAVLVLECATPQGTSHDLGPLLPIITGATPATAIRRAGRQSVLTTFVAATRAQHLLALAVHRDRLDPHRNHLKHDGWSIVDL